MANDFDDVVIPYDRDLGPVMFEHYWQDTARRIAPLTPRDVLEVARAKFRPDESVTFRNAAALAEAFRRELGANPTRYPMQAILFETQKP
jgi:hypothetical protein